MSPEIKRCNLTSVILLLKAFGVDDVVGFDYMDSPSRASIVNALETLYALGALDDKGVLSELGKKMSGFPIDPIFSKMLIESQEYGCTRDVINMIATLSIDPVFYSPHDKREEAYEAKKQFINHDGDHLTLLNVFQQFLSCKGDSQWCQDRFISYRSMKQITDIRNQLLDFCVLFKMDTKQRDLDPQILVKCLLAGCFRNTAIIQPDGSYKTMVGKQTVHIHPSSVLFGKKAPAVVYSELLSTSKKYMRNVSRIPIENLLELKYFSQ
jgi:HrpA-like RNA helicase